MCDFNHLFCVWSERHKFEANTRTNELIASDDGGNIQRHIRLNQYLVQRKSTNENDSSNNYLKTHINAMN